MPYRKFGKNDVNINTMKTYPRSEFFIYDSKIYYNNQPGSSSAAFAKNVLGDLDAGYSASSGFISLYEYNIDVPTYSKVDRAELGTRGGAASTMYIANRPSAIETAAKAAARGTNRPPIYPYVHKDSSRISLKMGSTISGTVYDNEFQYGDILTGSYPQWATIKREYITTPSASSDVDAEGATGPACKDTAGCSHNMNYWSLRNILNLYGGISPHYLVSSSYGDGWDKDQQTLNLIHIPSIFYGKRIRPGSVSLQWYYTGSLIAELKDSKKNGELIQQQATPSSPSGLGSGSVAGVVLYNEGFILLTGSWEMHSAKSVTLIPNSSNDTQKPKWTLWGAGARDDVNEDNVGSGGPTIFKKASFGLSFEGETTTQVMTLHAHAPRGKVNYSNNPTYIAYNQEQLAFTSSHVYEENSKRMIKNTVSSSYSDHSASFKRQVYISKIAVYDDNKNLIGIATLANPVLKKEDQDLTFKLKMDI